MAGIQIPTCGMKMDVPTGSSSVLSNQLCGESSDSELKLFLMNRSAPLRTILALAIVLCDSAAWLCSDLACVNLVPRPAWVRG